MFSKEKSMYKSIHFIALLTAFLISCGGSSEILESSSKNSENSHSGLLLVKNQLPAPQSFQSIQLYKKGNRNNPPVLKLDSNEKLVLEFDELTSLSGQFRLKFEHFDQNWNPSNIPEAWFLDGFNEIVISGGSINQLSEPNYFSYKSEFPNSRLKFLTSGNFMVHIYDFNSDTKLFSLPFFISEQAGDIESRVETVFNAGKNGAAIDQLFSIYEYPEEIEFPQFDLSVEFVQNRFWGSSKTTDSFNTSNQGNIRFYTSRDNSFSSSFDFIPLDLTDLNINLDKIQDWQPESVPPKVVLRPDILNFSSLPSQSYRSVSGLPESRRDSRYAEVEFRFDSGTLNTQNKELYVAGDFNFWELSNNAKLSYDQELDIWMTTLLMKEGNYRYKYFIKNSGSKDQELLPVNDTITKQDQSYQVFIYYKDPDRNYQRLLMTGNFDTR